MQNGANKEATDRPSPNISQDFLTGSTELGLDRIRTRLLDLTNRNKLLNFRHSNASSLRVVDVAIDSVFTRLRDGEKLAFLATTTGRQLQPSRQNLSSNIPRKVVIVGDPKQLPPTSFFQCVALDAEDDGAEELRTAVEEGESILDVASTLFQPVRRLRWHYRSRHHSLIAFSNAQF